MQEKDTLRVTQLLRRQWQEELERNGLGFASPPDAAPLSENGITCPACGTTGPLENGACSDCGLMLG